MHTVKGPSNVVHMIPRLPVNSGGVVIGGSASSVVSLVRKQDRLSAFRPSVLTGVHGENHLQEALPENVRSFPIPVAASPSSQKYAIEFIAKTLLSAGTSVKHSILHSHSGHWQYMGGARAVAMRFGRPWVHSLYCPPGGQFPEWLFRQIGAARAIVGMSENVRRHLIKAGIEEHRAFHIKPCIDTDSYQADGAREATRSSLGIAENATVLLFVGNAAHAKGFDVLAEAFEETASRWPSLHLVATFEEKGLSGTTEHLQSPDIAPRTRYLGVVPNMAQLIKAANAVVVPFRDTNGPSDYPVVILEAMASGTSVIASAIGGVPELIIEGETGYLVRPSDPASLARAVDTFMADRTTAKRFSTNALSLLHQEFEPASLVKQWDDLYESICA